MRINRFLVVLVVVLAAGLVTSLWSQATTQRRHIMLPGRTGDLPFSDGVMIGNTLYLSGKIGVDPATGRVPDDIDTEVKFALDAMKRTLGEAGMTMDHLVYVTVYCPDLTLYNKFNSIYRTYFTDKFPVRAFIGSGPLLRGGHFEVQGIAVK